MPDPAPEAAESATPETVEDLGEFLHAELANVTEDGEEVPEGTPDPDAEPEEGEGEEEAEEDAEDEEGEEDEGEEDEDEADQNEAEPRKLSRQARVKAKLKQAVEEKTQELQEAQGQLQQAIDYAKEAMDSEKRASAALDIERAFVVSLIETINQKGGLTQADLELLETKKQLALERGNAATLQQAKQQEAISTVQARGRYRLGLIESAAQKHGVDAHVLMSKLVSAKLHGDESAYDKVAAELSGRTKAPTAGAVKRKAPPKKAPSITSPTNLATRNFSDDAEGWLEEVMADTSI